MNVSPYRSFARRRLELFCWFIFIGLAVLFYHDMVFFLPRGIHEWAQADRLALAMQFYDQGFNFFKPATYSLESVNGITGVEFPLQAYLAALMGVVAGREHISFCFRLLDIAMALTGFYFLFKLIFEKTGNFLLSLVPGVFLMAAPVFVYYAGNYLPDTFSTSLVFVAFYFFFRFNETRNQRYLGWSLPFFVLAGLIKITSCIYFLAAVSFLLLWSYLVPHVLTFRSKITLLVGTAAGFLVIAAYTFYNKYLNAKYQSGLFLADSKPVKDMEMLRFIKSRFFDVWRFEYLTRFQYLILYVCFGLFLVFLLYHFRRNLAYTAVALIALLGGVAFFGLMGAQLIDHDYYIICAYYPLIIIFLLLALLLADRFIKNKEALNIGLGLLLIGLVFTGYKHHQLRLADTYKDFSNYYYYPWMLNGDQIITEAGIPENAKLLVMSTSAPNLALVYFDRKGVVWGLTNEYVPDLQAAKDKLATYNLDYVLLNQPDFKRLTAQHPDFLQYFVPVITTGNFLVLKPQ